MDCSGGWEKLKSIDSSACIFLMKRYYELHQRIMLLNDRINIGNDSVLPHNLNKSISGEKNVMNPVRWRKWKSTGHYFCVPGVLPSVVSSSEAKDGIHVSKSRVEHFLGLLGWSLNAHVPDRPFSTFLTMRLLPFPSQLQLFSIGWTRWPQGLWEAGYQGGLRLCGRAVLSTTVEGNPENPHFENCESGGEFAPSEYEWGIEKVWHWCD